MTSPSIILADKTSYIKTLDQKPRYQYMFLRPRQWGKSPHLNHVAASDLDLWKVCRPIDDPASKNPRDDEPPLRVNKRLHSLWDDDLSDEELHILVKAPRQKNTAAAPDLTQLLSLNCLVLGDKEDRMFTVKILQTENVSILKKLIKEENPHTLDRVDAKDLELSQVSLPVGDNLEEDLKKVDLVPLKPVLLISQVFPHVEANRLHVIVQAPLKEGSTTSDAGEEVKRDQISGLHQRYRNLISSILNAAPPSDSAKSSNYPKSQLAYSIYDGRYRANKPRTSVAPPVQLFNPFFGHFLDHMRSDIAVPDDIVRRT